MTGTLDGTCRTYLADLARVLLLIVDDFDMRKLPYTAAEDLIALLDRLLHHAHVFKCGHGTRLQPNNS